jgi:5-methylcytosine-specific restriction enzyme B
MAEVIKDILGPFLEQAQTSNLKTKHFKKDFKGLNVKVSFGQGGLARIPWISFLAEGQSTANGIYPVYLLYKDYNLLILAYGVSETIKPSAQWEFKSPQKKIVDFFQEKNLKVDRYGDSFVYSAYDLKNKLDWNELQRDIEHLIEEYKKVELESFEEITFEKKVFDFLSLVSSVDLSGLYFNQLMIKRFCSSLMTKPFLILTGLSGSGKTKLAQSFVKWISADPNQYKIIPVGADWTNREPLLGYPIALTGNEYIKPENGALDLLIEANENQDLPYFLILDEMNLSHVERYFADFLSAMESDEEIFLHSGSESISTVPPKIQIPKNLFFIGTVNIDETTHMFSPKVLDRANTIEFRITPEEMASFLNQVGEISMENLESKGAGMAKSFLDMALDKSIPTEGLESVKVELGKFFVELKKAGAEFGYRSATEILKLIDRLGKIDPDLSEDAKLDIAIIQKLLPKLHGSRRKLAPVLSILANLCLKESIKPDRENTTVEGKVFEVDADKIKYPISHEKLSRMHKAAIENGFASFAEA